MRQGGVLAEYDPGSLFCEMLRPGEPPHPALSLLRDRLRHLPIEALRRRAADAERDLLERGITFTVYSDATAIDRILPFDLIPRVITAEEWRTLEAGVIQRVRALNLFLHDVYHERKILADGVVPRELVLGNAGLLPGDDRLRSAARHLCACLRHRHHPRRDRALPGAGGQRPHAIRRRLCGREPAHDAARAVRPDGRTARAQRRRVRPAAASRDGGDRPGRRERSAGGAAVAGHLQLGLFRARVPGARDGRAAGRGRRTCWSRTAASGCAPPRAWRRCTRSIAG